MAKSVQCTKCGKWKHGRCAKMKRLTLTVAKGCVEAMKKNYQTAEELTFYNPAELVKSFCYFGED